MKKTSIITIVLFFCVSFNMKAQDELYLNYEAAINNPELFQYYVVIKFKNLNTGEIREVCTTAKSLKGALRLEYNLGYDDMSSVKIIEIATNNKERYFEFKNDSALTNLGAEYYSIAELKKLEEKVHFDSIARNIRKKKDWSIRLDETELIMYAHALFNLGVLTGHNNCLGGSLIYVDRNFSPY